MRTVPFLALILVLLNVSAKADVRDSLKAGETAIVSSVVDGDTVVLGHPIQGASEIRLVGIQAPKLSLGRRNFKAWPLSPESKIALEKLTLGKSVQLFYGGTNMDRHGRLLAHLFLPDGTWVQGEMLAQGMARVYTFPDNRSVTDQMYESEQQARSKRSGIWYNPFYGIRQASETLIRRIGTFQIIEGQILEVAKVKGTVYLNFADNWRTDFTISIRSKAVRMFKPLAIDLLSLKGQKIRVRGWLKKRNGPMIELTHPEQLEIL